jgi:type I restriction enzyme M protein
MIAIEKENPSLQGALPKDYARPALDKVRLGETIDLFSFKVGDEASRSKDVLGRVYEYFLSKFASAEGKNGGLLILKGAMIYLLKIGLMVMFQLYLQVGSMVTIMRRKSKNRV